MNVSGLRSEIRRKSISVSAIRPSNLRLNLAPAPPSARRSTTSKPMLCRVPSYLLPGLPRPTTSFIMAPNRRPMRRAGHCHAGIRSLFLFLAFGLDDLGLLRGGLGLGLGRLGGRGAAG